jgi:hypothetical protein
MYVVNDLGTLGVKESEIADAITDTERTGNGAPKTTPEPEPTTAANTIIRLTKSNPRFTFFRNIAIAVSDDDPWIALTCLKIEGKTLIGSDGKRLHVNTGTYKPMFPDGLYQVLKCNRSTIELKKVEGYQYPDWKRVFHTTDRMIHWSKGEDIAFGSLILQTEMILQKRFIDDLPDGDYDVHYVRREGKENPKGMIFRQVTERRSYTDNRPDESTDTGFLAIIMPCGFKNGQEHDKPSEIRTDWTKMAVDKLPFYLEV